MANPDDGDGGALPSLETNTLGESAAELLRQRILSGALKPGSRLVEAEIARQLGISRGPVREALATLRGEGLAREEPRRGAYVTALSALDIREIYQVRAALESGAARLVILRRDEEARACIRAALDRLQRAAATDDRSEFVEADLALHEELCRVSGNERLFQAWLNQVGILRTLIRLETTQVFASFRPLLEDHEEFVHQILAGNVNEAADACWRLFRNSNDLLEKAYATDSDDGATIAPEVRAAALYRGA